MAKSKKQEPAGEAAPAKAPAAKKTPAPKQGGSQKAGGAKKSAKTDKAPASAPQAPLIDTGLAAQAAAAMVANRVAAGLGATQQGDAPAQQTPAAGTPQESSAFRNLKQNLNKPAAGTLGGILGPAGGQKKFSQGFGGPKHTGPGGGRNQTFGADVNRAGVPRRTGG